MNKRKKINNNMFTIKFCTYMQHLGIKTVGQADKFFTNCDNNMKLSVHSDTIRVSRLKREMEEVFNKQYPLFIQQ